MEYAESVEGMSTGTLMCRVFGHTPSRDPVYLIPIVTSTHSRTGAPKTGERRTPCHWGCGLLYVVKLNFDTDGLPTRAADGNKADYSGTSGYLQKPKAQRAGAPVITKAEVHRELLLRTRPDFYKPKAQGASDTKPVRAEREASPVASPKQPKRSRAK